MNKKFISEKDLIAGLMAGDMDSYELMFKLYYTNFKAFVVSMLKDPYSAEDIVQNVFMKVWLYRGSLNAELSLKNYLYVLAKREVLNHIRAKNNFTRMVTDYYSASVRREERETNRQLGGSEIDSKELEKHINDVISNMPDRRREVFMMSRYDNMSNKEIADALDLSTRTVERHIQLSLKELKNKIDYS